MHQETFAHYLKPKTLQIKTIMGTPRNHSVIRSFKILCSFDEQHPEMTIAEISKRTGSSQATIHRFMLTLEEIGAVARNKNGRFQLGMLIADLGGRILQSQVLTNIVQPYVDSIVEKFDETVHVAIQTSDLVTYIGKGESTRSLKIGTYIGKQLPAYCSGVGKMLLSGLTDEALNAYISRINFRQLTYRTITEPEPLRLEIQKVRQQNYAIDDEEAEEGLRCIAVPIYDFNKRMMASISISGPTTRLDLKNMDNYLTELNKAAEQLSQKVYPSALKLNSESEK